MTHAWRIPGLVVLVVGSAATQSAPAVLAPPILGIVRDGAGRPAAAAEVELLRWPAAALFAPSSVELDASPQVVAKTRTDADGAFRFAVDAGSVHGLIARGSAGTVSAPWADVVGGDVVELRLAATVLLQGRVRHAESAPAGGATVRAAVPAHRRAALRHAGLARGCHFEVTTVADAKGWFQLALPRPAENAPFLLWASLGAVRGTSALVPADHNACSLVVPRPSALRVRCVDRATGTPLAGVRLGLTADLAAVTGADGRAGLAVGTTGWLQVVPRAHQRRVLDLVDLAPQARAGEVEVALDPGVALTARLLDATGAPLRAARVLCMTPAGGDGAAASATAWFEHTDADGRLAVGCLAAGGGDVVTVHVEHGGGFALVWCGPVPGPVDLGRRSLADLGSITGTLRLPGPGPLVDACVLVQPAPAGEARAAWPWELERFRVVPVSRAGHFTLAGVPPGRFALFPLAAGVAPVATAVELNGPHAAVALGPAGMSLGGRVLTPDGAPAAGAKVTCRMTQVAVPPALLAWLGPRTVCADADGRFRIDGLMDGVDHQLTAEGPGGVGAGTLAGLVRAATDLELVLRR